MTDREVEPHSSNGQKELPTILRFHVKHQLLGNDEEAYSASPNMTSLCKQGRPSWIACFFWLPTCSCR